MNCLCKGNPDALLVCNGFKDKKIISLALLDRKLALNMVIVLEQEEELDLVIGLSKKMSVRHEREEGSFVLGFWRQFCLQILFFVLS